MRDVSGAFYGEGRNVNNIAYEICAQCLKQHRPDAYGIHFRIIEVIKDMKPRKTCSMSGEPRNECLYYLERVVAWEKEKC